MGEEEDKLMDIAVCLEPTNVVGAAQRGFELLKISDNTVALYKTVKWRTSDDLLSSGLLKDAGSGVLNDSGSSFLKDSGQSLVRGPGSEKNAPENAAGEGEAGEEKASATETQAAAIPVIPASVVVPEESVENDGVMNGPELTADEELQNDLELERVEKAVFEMVDESDRSLFINFMRTETELFLLFADWTEKQRRKLVDLQLRNGDVWAEVAKHKAAAVRELEQLHAVFDLMKTAPVDGTFPQPPAATEEMERKKMRQLTVTGAINQVNEEESYREILTALRRRKKVGAELAAQLRQIAQTITAGAQEQVHFAHIVAHLCRRWNVTRIPYEQQVFKGSNLNYPYRAELWVELLSIPSRYWGVELLEDTTRSLAPTLWEAADNAGYLPDFSSTNTSSSTRRGEDVTAPGGSGGGGSANGTGSTGATASGVATSTGAISTGSAASPGDRHWESGRESATEAEQGRGGEEPGEENAGFEQHTEVYENWKEKRVARSFGHPFLLNPSSRVSSPFGPPPWCEVFAASKAEEERLPPEAWLDDQKPVAAEELDAPVNIIVRLSGDVGAAVKEKRQLQINLRLLRLVGSGIEYTSTEQDDVDGRTATGRTATGRTATGRTATGRTATDFSTSGAGSEWSKAEGSKKEGLEPEEAGSQPLHRRISTAAGLEAVKEELENFLLGVQRVCAERTMFAILQSQAMRALREMAAPAVDDESLAAVLSRLRESRTVKAELLPGNVVLVKPVLLSPDSRMFRVSSTPSLHVVPASWSKWVLSGPRKGGNRDRPLLYALAKNIMSVRSCRCDQVRIVLHDVPIMFNQRAAAAHADIEVKIKFADRTQPSNSQPCGPTGSSQGGPDTPPSPSEALAKLQRYLEWLGWMAVCFVRNQCLSVLSNEEALRTVFDLHHATLPGLRVRHQGALLLNNLVSWIVSHAAMHQYNDNT